MVGVADISDKPPARQVQDPNPLRINVPVMQFSPWKLGDSPGFLCPEARI